MTNVLSSLTELTLEATTDEMAAASGRLDSRYREAVSQYVRADEETRQAMRALLPEDSRWLFVLSHHALTVAVEEHDGERLFDALVGHCLEDFRWDARENFRRLEAIWSAALALELSPTDVFERALGMSSERGQHSFRSFLAGKQPSKAAPKKPKAKRSRS